jgi:hypothetical protein
MTDGSRGDAIPESGIALSSFCKTALMGYPRSGKSHLVAALLNYLSGAPRTAAGWDGSIPVCGENQRFLVNGDSGPILAPGSASISSA